MATRCALLPHRLELPPRKPTCEYPSCTLQKVSLCSRCPPQDKGLTDVLLTRLRSQADAIMSDLKPQLQSAQPSPQSPPPQAAADLSAAAAGRETLGRVAASNGGASALVHGDATAGSRSATARETPTVTDGV